VERGRLPAAIDGQGKPERAGRAEVRQQVECAADGSAGEQHVIHQQKRFIVDGNVEVRRAHQWPRANLRKIVAIERDVEDAAADF
jgi:hypothetical protein